MPAVSEARGDGAPEVAGVGEAAADDAAEEEEEDGDGADPGDFGGGAVQVGYVVGLDDAEGDYEAPGFQGLSNGI